MLSRIGPSWTENKTHIAELYSIETGAAVDAFYLEAKGCIPNCGLNTTTYRFDAQSARRIRRAEPGEGDFVFVMECSDNDQLVTDEALRSEVYSAPLKF
jgi:hypothetical protein